jgi:tRNA dimethylallyltransferase
VLHARLAGVDPLAAARLHPNDLRRIIRALEVWQITGRPISAWQEQWQADKQETAEAPPRVLWLDLPREQLYARIDERVQRMIGDGLVDEVRALRHLPRPMSREAAQALGYKELSTHVDGRCTLPEAVVQIQTRSRNFAKRQMTWFRHLPGCRPATRELTFSLWGLKMDC